MKTVLSIAAAAAALLAAASTAQAQATALLREGDLLPGGLVVTAIHHVDVNGIGGWMALVTADGGAGQKINLAWGSPDGVVPPGILFQEGTHDGFAQSGWDRHGDMDDQGRIAYSAQGPTVGSDAADSAFVGDVLAEATPPLPGNPLLRPGITDDGMLWYVDDRAGQDALRVGLPPVTLYATGDQLPNLPGPIQEIASPQSPSERHAQFSSRGSHHLVEVRLPGPVYSLVLDGAGLLVDGSSLLATSSPVPAAIGGTGTETWSWVRSMSVNEAGGWALAVDTWDPVLFVTSHVLVQDGQIRSRSGDLIDGFDTSDHEPWIVRHTDDGRLLHGWSNCCQGDDALFFDDRLLAASGDAVDLDGDGATDPGALLTVMFGYPLHGSAEVGADGFLYFRSAVDVNGTPLLVLDDVACVLRVPLAPAPVAYCTPKLSSSGCAAAMRTSDPESAPVSGASDDSVLCTTVEGAKNGLLFWGTGGPAAIPFQGGTLCVLPPLNRTPVQSSGGTPGTCAGAYALVLNDGASPWDLGPGATAWWQAWYRDPALGDGFGVALSNAIEVAFQ